MKRMIFLFSLAASGCLTTGCEVRPMDANKLFGVSNPTLRAKVTGYGVLEIPTNFDGTFKLDKNPDGTIKLDVTVKSNASGVIESEGTRLTAMEKQREMDENRAVAQEQIRSSERVELYKTIASIAPLFAGAMTPKPAAPIDVPGIIGAVAPLLPVHP